MYIERWFAETPNAVELLMHSRWPIAIVLNHMARATRHAFHLDFTAGELAGNLNMAFPTSLNQFASWTESLGRPGHSLSFVDTLSAVLRLGEPLDEAKDSWKPIPP